MKGLKLQKTVLIQQVLLYSTISDKLYQTSMNMKQEEVPLYIST